MKPSLFWTITGFFHCIWIAVLCFSTPATQTLAFTHVSFYALLLLSLSGLYAFRGVRPTRELLFALSLGLIATAVVFLSVKPEWRVLSDETNLISVSRSFLLDHTAQNITMGKGYYELFKVISAGTPTRPLLFPFLIYLVHLLLGYRADNAFIVNALLCTGFLTALAYWFRARSGKVLACAAIFAVLCNPLFTLGVTSAGFDVLAVVLVLASFVFTYRYARVPNADNLLRLSFVLILLAHCRYESIIVLPLVFVGLGALKLLRLEDFYPHRFFYALTPFFLAPIFLQRYLTRGQYENPTGGPPLAPEYFAKYLPRFFTAQTKLNFEYPYPAAYLIFAFAVGLVGFFLWLKKRENIRPYSVVALCFVALNLVYISHHFGDAMHASQARFFLLWCISLSLVPCLLALRYGWLSPEKALVASLAAFCLYHPLAIRNDFMKALTLPRETRFYRAFLAKEPDTRLMVIYERPGQVIADGLGAVDFDYARNNSEVLLKELRQGLYREIYAIQRCELATSKPVKSDELGAEFALVSLARMQSTESACLTISKVKHEY